MSTPIFDRPINHVSAWTNAGIGGRDGLERRLPAEALAAIDQLLAGVKSRPVAGIRREDFDHPALSPLMAEVRNTLLEGLGAVVLSGLDASRYSLEDLERIYWGLGTHIGRGVVQSQDGDLIGHVRKADSPTPRGYLTDMELKPHADSHEILTLMTVTKAESGGMSGLVSSLAMHDRILQTRPELLAPLYEGYFYGSHETRPMDEPLSPTKVPVYCNVDGKVSCMVNPFFMMMAARRMGTQMPADLREALDYFYEVSQAPDLIARFMLEPGEMMFWSNYTNLHARTAFVDSPQNTRLLLRLWLDPEGGRPVVPAFLTPINNRYDGEVRARASA